MKIIIDKNNEKINFYLKDSNLGKIYLFSQRFTKAVYDYFSQGRSISEVLGFKQWFRNPRLDKTISKIPIYIRYAEREYGYCLSRKSTGLRRKKMNKNLKTKERRRVA